MRYGKAYSFRHILCFVCVVPTLFLWESVNAQPLGRLFFTPRERESLQQQGGIPLRMAQPPQNNPKLPTDFNEGKHLKTVEKRSKTTKSVQDVAVNVENTRLTRPFWVWNGYVQRGDGLQTVWMNGQLFYWRAPSPHNQVPAPQVTLANGRKVMLKVGQLYDPNKQVIQEYSQGGGERVQPSNP